MGGYRHYAGLKGTKTLNVGKDASAFSYTDIQSALDAAQANDCLVVHPGTYTASAQLTVTKPIRMVGLGGPAVCKLTCDSDVTGSMIDIELAAQSAASEVYFEGLCFEQGNDNLDVFSVDNASVAQTLDIKFVNCDIKVLDAASTGNAIDLNHITVAQIINLSVVGSRSNQVDCVDIVPGNASDVYLFEGVYMTENGNASAIISSAADKACIFRLHEVKFKTALKALTGGHASQTVVAYGCCTESVGAALVTGDLAGSQTETVISP